MEFQKTIETEVKTKGVGLHSGKSVSVTLKPSLPDAGINFVRVDLPGSPVIKGHVTKLVDLTKSPRRTTVSQGEAEVQTIEHFMAALAGLGIDNITIEIDGDEMLGLDGSAADYVDLLLKAGIDVQEDSSRRSFSITEPVWIEEDSASLVILPADDFRISYTLNYPLPMLHSQHVTLSLNDGVFKSDIAPARTFCLESETKALISQGMGKGATYENTLVIGQKGVIKNKVRFPDEFTRHKILDLIGDLYLLGMPLKGHVIAIRSGHPLNLRLLQKVYQQMQRRLEGGIRSAEYHMARPQMDIGDIQKILPHRYPFLLVDKVLELEEGKRVRALKNVTVNDYFFRGHFPGRPVMPGVLIVEAMAQTAGILILCRKENQGKLAYFMGIDNVRFRKTVVPGDQLILDVDVIKIKSKTGVAKARAFVDNKEVAEAELMFSLVEV
jgi:UDP-3-O-[3-hydroxymyristoyl] N-acetylglucosamine deacetylase/3-hydroxyacyl-[acyl-carrier-protein] dehydratase